MATGLENFTVGLEAMVPVCCNTLYLITHLNLITLIFRGIRIPEANPLDSKQTRRLWNVARGIITIT